MKKVGTFLLIPALCLLFGASASAQIKGLFEKEEPVFQATVLPTAERGTVQLVFYFTHSKASSIETSVWLRDEGTGMSGSSSNVLVRGLRETYNRQQDTITITGLNDQHFYTFGVDYRSPGFMSSKFNTTVLKSNFRYEALPAKTVQTVEAPRQTGAPVPCRNPDLFVQIQPNGYCGAQDRPAVQVQCMNCEGVNWTFDVQLRTASSGWLSLRADGQSQTASGNGIRVEPLCTLESGTYYVRVQAQGEHCTTPITHNVSSFLTIKDPQETLQERSITINNNAVVEIPTLPDTCLVQAQAVLQGKALKGTLQLAAGSPCGTFYPYAVVHYVHPGHRDLMSKPIALQAGASVPFELQLDDRDATRSIHTLQIIAYTRQQPGAEGIPMSAFWIKAGSSGALASNANNGEPKTADATAPTPYQSQNGGSTQLKSEPLTTTTINDPFRESLFTEELQTVSVKASDPNCTQIQDLNVVFFNNQQGQGDRPLYITWMNPRCCQEDGCKYTIWAGENPDKLRILVEGSKRGVFIRELLQDLLSTDTYIEVSVKTANGNRKAAYVLNEGALYGIEALADYRDRLRPQQSNALIVPTETTIKGGNGAVPPQRTTGDQPTIGGDLAARSPMQFEKAQKNLTNYSPCKYAREILVVGDRPAVQGNQVKIQYDFADKDYRYTLYFQPAGTTEWFIAPGTRESQENPAFTLNITPYHSGKYAILVHKAAANWGCIAAPLEQAIEIQVGK